MDKPLTLGEKIRHLRKRLKMTQEELAGGDFTKSFISQIEKNEANPSLRSLRIIAARLGKPVSYFLEDRDTEEGGEGQGKVDQYLAVAERLLASGRLDDASAALESALEDCPETDFRRRGVIHRFLATIARRRGAPVGQVAAELERSIENLRLAGLAEELARSYEALGELYAQAGLRQKALDAYSKALVELEKDAEGDTYTRLRILTQLGIHCVRNDDPASGRDYLNQALRLSSRTEHYYRYGEALLELAGVEEKAGRTEEARALFDRALAFYRAVGDEVRAARVMTRLGQLLTASGEAGEAEAWLSRAVAVLKGTTSREEEAAAHLALSQLYLKQGQVARARQECEEALHQSKDPATRARGLRALARLLREAGDWEGAAQSLTEAVQLWSELGFHGELAQAYSELGSLYRAQGDFERANEYLMKSVELYQSPRNTLP